MLCVLQLAGEHSTVNSILQSMAKLGTQAVANPTATAAGMVDGSVTGLTPHTEIALELCQLF